MQSVVGGTTYLPIILHTLYITRSLVGGPSVLLDFVLHALRALRPCDPRNDALDSDQTLVLVDLVLLILIVVVVILLLLLLVIVVIVLLLFVVVVVAVLLLLVLVVLVLLLVILVVLLHVVVAVILLLLLVIVVVVIVIVLCVDVGVCSVAAETIGLKMCR